MISFFQQFNQYLPYDTAPVPPSCCQEVLAKLTVTSELNEVPTACLHDIMSQQQLVRFDGNPRAKTVDTSYKDGSMG